MTAVIFLPCQELVKFARRRSVDVEAVDRLVRRPVQARLPGVLRAAQAGRTLGNQAEMNSVLQVTVP